MISRRPARMLVPLVHYTVWGMLWIVVAISRVFLANFRCSEPDRTCEHLVSRREQTGTKWFRDGRRC